MVSQLLKICIFIKRQAVLELLTLASCLNITGDDTVMMIQGVFGFVLQCLIVNAMYVCIVNRNKIIPYLYYPKTDFLTRPTQPIIYYDAVS